MGEAATHFLSRCDEEAELLPQGAADRAPHRVWLPSESRSSAGWSRHPGDGACRSGVAAWTGASLRMQRAWSPWPLACGLLPFTISQGRRRGAGRPWTLWSRAASSECWIIPWRCSPAFDHMIALGPPHWGLFNLARTVSGSRGTVGADLEKKENSRDPTGECGRADRRARRIRQTVGALGPRRANLRRRVVR
jgi:hypothetical protein